MTGRWRHGPGPGWLGGPRARRGAAGAGAGGGGVSEHGWDIEGPIRAAAERYNLDHGIFRRQLVAESGLDPNIVNRRSGAAGIGQFMPATAQGLGIDPLDPNQAIPAAAWKQHAPGTCQPFRRRLHARPGQYNWGPGNVA